MDAEADSRSLHDRIRQCGDCVSLLQHEVRQAPRAGTVHWNDRGEQGMTRDHDRMRCVYREDDLGNVLQGDRQFLSCVTRQAI